MWIVFACGSALFAGLTAVLAKAGIREIDSTLATALRTPVVLVAACAMVLIRGSQSQLASIDAATLGWLIASGLATGASWLCYFKALQLGEASMVAPIDKLSTVLTVLLAVLLLGESLTVIGGVGVVLMVAGTLLMLDRSDAVTLAPRRAGSRGWLLYALGSAVFAALTAILGKLGIVGVESNLGTAIRTAVVLVMAWAMVAVSGRRRPLPSLRGHAGACLRLDDRGLMALLLQGAAGWPRQCHRSDRQAEHPRDRRVLRPHPARAPEPALPRGPRPADTRHPRDGAVVASAWPTSAASIAGEPLST